MKTSMIMAVITAVTLFTGLAEQTNVSQTQDSLLPYIKVDKVWASEDFDVFLEHLSIEQRSELKNVLHMDCNKNYGNDELIQIKKCILWESSNVFTYPFKSNDVDYDKIVQWVAKKAGVDAKDIAGQSTFKLEKLVCEKVFNEYLDSLTPGKREELLKNFTSNDRLLTNSGYVAILLGLPGGGWAWGGILAGRADYKDTLAAIIQIYKFKTQALNNSGTKVLSMADSFDLGQKKYFSANPEEKEVGRKILQELASRGHQSAIYILKINNETR